MMRRTVGNSVLGTVVAQRRARMLVLLLAVALCGYLLVVPALPVLVGRPVPPGGTLTPPRQATTSAKGRSHQVGTGTTQPRSGPVPAASAATHVPPVAGAVGTQPRHTDVTLPKVGGQRLSQ